MAAWLSTRVITCCLCVHLAVIEMSNTVEPPLISDSPDLLSSNTGSLENRGTFNKGFNNNKIILTKRAALNEHVTRTYKGPGFQWHKDPPLLSRARRQLLSSALLHRWSQ